MPDTCALIPLSAVCAFFLGLLGACLGAVCKNLRDLSVARRKLDKNLNFEAAKKFEEILTEYKTKSWYQRLRANCYIGHEARVFIAKADAQEATYVMGFIASCQKVVTGFANWCRSWWPRNDQNKSVEIKTPTTV